MPPLDQVTIQPTIPLLKMFELDTRTFIFLPEATPIDLGFNLGRVRGFQSGHPYLIVLVLHSIKSLTSLPLQHLRIEASFFGELVLVRLLSRTSSLTTLKLVDMEDASSLVKVRVTFLLWGIFRH